MTYGLNTELWRCTAVETDHPTVWEWFSGAFSRPLVDNIHSGIESSEYTSQTKDQSSTLHARHRTEQLVFLLSLMLNIPLYISSFIFLQNGSFLPADKTGSSHINQNNNHIFSPLCAVWVLKCSCWQLLENKRLRKKTNRELSTNMWTYVTLRRWKQAINTTLPIITFKLIARTC